MPPCKRQGGKTGRTCLWGKTILHFPWGRSKGGLSLPWPELNPKGHRPPACSHVLYLSDLTTVIYSQYQSTGSSPNNPVHSKPKSDTLLDEVIFMEDAFQHSGPMNRPKGQVPGADQRAAEDASSILSALSLGMDTGRLNILAFFSPQELGSIIIFLLNQN